jgi:hypothetical protein
MSAQHAMTSRLRPGIPARWAGHAAVETGTRENEFIGKLLDEHESGKTAGKTLS